MKLKNKETGETKDVVMSRYFDSSPILVSEITPDENGQTQGWAYNSLAELNAEWEDVPEGPKKYWWISDRLTIYEGEARDDTIWHRDMCKQIGNYFETKEEAEKAREKINAWKRLKDKGFKFEGWDNTDRSTIHNFSLFVAIEDLESINKDLDLLFGGEE